MLVLKRKVGERIMLGDAIELAVLDIEGETVKLGFVAPKHIQILRKELYEGLAAENLRAGQSNVSGGKEVMGLLKDFNKFQLKEQKE